jgi:hypothetical protein
MWELGGADTLSADEVAYQGWEKAFRICNDTVQLTILTEVGPRILSFGFQGEENQFYENPEHSGKCGGDEYRVYGGHRLWVSPELERSYYPDNVPVAVRTDKDAFIFTAPPESKHPGTDLQKEMEIRLDGTGTHVSVTHRIRNFGKEVTKLAPWALSVMAGGGRAILPLPPRAPVSKEKLLPEGILALWSYTDLADTRWKIGTKYIQLLQANNSASRFREQMGGIYNPSGWGAYFRQGHLFVKSSKVHQGSAYPDFGCNFEVYTDPFSLELETLGPLQDLEPGQTAEHAEEWWLFKDVPGGEDDAWIDSIVLKLVGTVIPAALHEQS